jgi:hypothetical protein
MSERRYISRSVQTKARPDSVTDTLPVQPVALLDFAVA